jgi:glycogen debranching enzyme
LVEVQGYTYAALVGAAELADVQPLGHDASDLRRRASDLRDRFNDVMWDERGWFVLGVDGDGRAIDSLTTNPGHALWSGIADADLADRYLDRLCETALWSGWGLRTLAASMGAYDPLSYHNGSVWPHDTAICAAGAARYGRWDVVDTIVEGALAAATHFGGRPPELFAGISRAEVPVPVAYPASCSPQAWSSASVLLLVRTMFGLVPTADGVELERRDFETLPAIRVSGLRSHGSRFDISVADGVASVAPASTQ